MATLKWYDVLKTLIYYINGAKSNWYLKIMGILGPFLVFLDKKLFVNLCKCDLAKLYKENI